MDDECEEGEIFDVDEDEDVYTPLERPSAPETVNQPIRLPESESDDSLESSTDSDSSSGPCLAKKRKVQRLKPPHQSRRDGLTSGQSSVRNKKYNIWAAGLAEEAITTELENLNGLDRFTRDRGVESYDFTQAGPREDDEDEDLSNDEAESTGSKDADVDSLPDLRAKLSNKRKHDSRGHVKQRLGRRFSPSDICRNKNEDLYHARVILDLKYTASDTNEEVAKDMANKLLEEKEDLIIRVVNVLGKEKAIALFEETQRVEAQGGMLIMNGSRRRSPGGVFLFILKGDDTITSDQKSEIFQDDMKKSIVERRTLQRMRYKKARDASRMELAKDGLPCLDPNLPDLLTRAELVVNQAKKGTKTSDGSVSNPPPSPATDNRGESSNDSPPHRPAQQTDSLNSRALADYQDDFLDVYGEGMDEF